MKTKTADFRKSFARIRRAAGKGRMDQSLGALEAMLRAWPDHPVLLVEKARLIQLSDFGELAAAKRALVRATKVDPTNADAWNELARYLFCIDDQAHEAEENFDQGIRLSLDRLADAVAGKIDVALEILSLEAKSPTRARIAEMEELLRQARFVLQSPGIEETWAIVTLRETVPNLERRLRSLKSNRNGK